MKKIRKISINMILLFYFISTIGNFKVENVLANEVTLENELSQNEYNGMRLIWEYNDILMQDLLLEIKDKSGKSIIYSYDENGRRINKCIDGEVISISYGLNSGYDTIINNNQKITYIYGNDYNMGGEFIEGFIYNNQKYDFIYDNYIIVGISKNNIIIAKYIYDDEYNFYGTQSLEEEEWILNTDKDFVGNINKIRFLQMFYDEETGWYYNGRYYDCGANRYVDGISPEMANELEDIYGYRALIRSYEFGLPYVHSEKARYSANMDSVEIVGRVFYCEAGTSTSDWDAVAWAVYNRMKSTGRTAFSIVTNGDFSAFNNGSYMFSTSGWYNTTKFYRCIENSELLNNNEKPFAAVSYISNQKNFRSISTFSDKYSSDGYTQKFDGVEIKNVVIPGVGIIGADTRSINKLNYESCQFNFYFDYYYE